MTAKKKWNWSFLACVIGSSRDTIAPLVHVGHVPGNGILFFDDTDDVYNVLEAAHTETLFMYALFVIGLHVILVHTCTVSIFIHLYYRSQRIIIW